MSEDHEFDPTEYAEQLGYVDELTTNDFTDPAAERAKSPGELRVSRRDLIVKGGIGAAAAAGLGALAGPAAGGTSSAEQYTGTLNVISLGVEWPPGAEQQAEKDLGFKFNVQLMGTNAQVQKSITAPKSFDIGGLYNYQFQPIWPTGNFQPVDRLKIRAWKDFYPIFTKGKVLLTNRGCTQGQGDAPYRMLYVDPNGSTGLPKTKEAGPQNKQIVQWWNQATNKAIRRQAAASLAPGPAGPLQHGLDGLRRRRPQQAARAGLLGRAAEHEVEGPRRRPQRPGHRHGRPRQRRASPRADEDQGPGQHDPRRDGPAVQDPDQVQEERPVPCVLGDLQRVREPHGLEGGRDRVDVVAGRGAARRAGRGLPLRVPEGGHPWLVQRPGHSDARDGREARRRSTTTSTGCTRAASARRSCARATTSRTARSSSPGSRRTGPRARRRSRRPSTTSGTSASRRRATCPGITGKVGDIKKGQVRDGGSFVKRSCKYTVWNSFYEQNVYQVKKFNEFLSA